MAISPFNQSDIYDGMRYYEAQEQRYRAEMERQRQRQNAMQQMAYNPYTDTYGGVTAQQIQEGPTQKPVEAKQPEYLNNKNLLLLGEAQ